MYMSTSGAKTGVKNLWCTEYIYIFNYIYIYIYIDHKLYYLYREVKKEERLVHAVVPAVQQHNIHTLPQSLCILWRSFTTGIYRDRARELTGS